MVCQDARLLAIRLELTQTIGRLKVVGSKSKEFDTICDGTPQAFTAVVRSQTGLFGGGKAVASLTGFACNMALCKKQTLTDVEILLRRSAD